jgi:hypothetical protein
MAPIHPPARLLFRAFILCESMASHIEETEELFRPEREAYLIDLQSRLRRLEDWRQEHGITR